MKEVKLPSGATLKIHPAPFKEAKALYMAILKEAKGIHIDSKTEMAEIYKNLFCTGFSSEDIERPLWVCLGRCQYDGGKGALKIDADTFEPLEARDDYMQVCMEVAKENILPFVKSLYAEYKRMLAMTESDQA